MTKEERIRKNEEFLTKLEEKVKSKIRQEVYNQYQITNSIEMELSSYLLEVYKTIIIKLSVNEFIDEVDINLNINLRQLHSVKRILERCEEEYLSTKIEPTLDTVIQSVKENYKDIFSESILQEAERITTNSRQEQYGNVEQSFSTYKSILKSTFNIYVVYCFSKYVGPITLILAFILRLKTFTESNRESQGVIQVSIRI
jgi:hypothetical protein